MAFIDNFFGLDRAELSVQFLQFMKTNAELIQQIGCQLGSEAVWAVQLSADVAKETALSMKTAKGFIVGTWVAMGLFLQVADDKFHFKRPARALSDSVIEQLAAAGRKEDELSSANDNSTAANDNDMDIAEALEIFRTNPEVQEAVLRRVAKAMLG